MHPFQPIALGITLAATASAVDISFYVAGSACTGSYIRCSTVNPDTCCALSSSLGVQYNSVSFGSFPTTGAVEAYASRDNRCSDKSQTSRRPVCLSRGPYLSAGVTTVVGTGGKVTSEGGSVVRTADGGGVEQKMACQKPDQLVLEDGTVFDITGLGAEEVLGLLSR